MKFALLLLLFAVHGFGEETLRYNVNWPSGLTLGEARLVAKPEAEGKRRHEFSLEASIPGFAVSEIVRSLATKEFCSLELQKNAARGKRKAAERTTFRAAAGMATRETLGGGGKTEIPIPACPHDALTFLQFTRQELAQGRIPAAQPVFYGATYQVGLQFGGTQQVRTGDKVWSADRIAATLKGPASEISFEMFFARDAARTPVLIRVPFVLGVFSMEIVPEP